MIHQRLTSPLTKFLSALLRSTPAVRFAPGLSGSELPDEPWRAEVLSREALGDLALRLAQQHDGTFGVSRGTKLLSNYRSNRATLRRVYHRLAEAAHQGETLTAGAEWLLDNYHVVERHAAAIKRFLPAGFYRTLPQFQEGPFRGFPRIYQLALEFIVHTDAVVDSSRASFFISSYQKRLELRSGELWAFPIMLRFALLENLRRLTREAEKELLARREVFALVDVVVGDESRTGTEIMMELAQRIRERESFLPHGALELLKRLRGRGRKAAFALQFLEENLRERGLDPEDLLRSEDHSQAARQISVGNTLLSLNAIDQMNWREWFEGVSLVEGALRRDPAALYGRCDFLTRDRIRHEVEKIAKSLDIPDSQIAERVVEYARHAQLQGSSTHTAFETGNGHPAESGTTLPPQPTQQYTALQEIAPQKTVTCHVGFYLDGAGRARFERELGYNPPLIRQLGRAVAPNAVAAYLTAIGLVMAALLGYVALIAHWTAVSGPILALTIVLALIPLSELASSLVQYLVTRSVPARPLPKLSHEGPIAQENRTIVAVHTIFNTLSSIQRAIDGLEVRFLGNDDPALTFVLMADLPDSRTEEAPGDKRLIEATQEGIETLNARHAPNGPRRFALFYRKRVWNPSEGVWMGWERKRGKIEELNRFLLGEGSGTLQLIVGDPDQLKGVRYVITLDSDTQLSRDVAKKLIATIAHPMNQAVVDPKSRRVVSGYAIIQPRVTISLTSATHSEFAHLFSGQAGLDPYTNIVSNVYQDLFGEGSFVGKAIYDLRPFAESLADRVPENTMLSHDLFEGCFARVGLASDIEVYDDFPSRYMAHSKRLHRWVRGDWQLLPWLTRKVPTPAGRVRSQLTAIGRWKIIDNLRRSLVAPTCVAALLGGWLFLPGGPLVWNTLILMTIAFPVFTGLANVFAWPGTGTSLGGFLGDIGRDLWRHTLRAGCAVCFLPHQCALMLHAITITLYRVCISRRHLLEWEPAERSEHRARTEDRDFLSLFLPVTVVALGVAVYAALRDIRTLPFSLPIVLAWCSAPWIARKTSRPLQAVVPHVSPEDREYLRTAALDTFEFFDTFMRAEYHYLMPDNLQVAPHEVVAERTSPTNISLSLLSCISAYDLGFIPLHKAIFRAARALETVVAMEKYRGHLFNWYNIKTLEPLHPRYISTVDSGNMLGHLYTLMTVLEETPATPLLSLEHLRATLEQITAVCAERRAGAATVKPVSNQDPQTQRSEELLYRSLEQLSQHLAVECKPNLRGLSAAVTHCAEFLRTVQGGAAGLGQNPDKGVRRALRLIQELAGCRPVCAWLEHLHHTAATAAAIDETQKLALVCREALGQAERCGWSADSMLPVIEQLQSALDSCGDAALKHAAQLRESLRDSRQILLTMTTTAAVMHAQCEKLIAEMDFSFLYDGERALFTIGFNTEYARRDGSFYDLLASEARLLSFLAVARGEVPQKHWFSLGRSITSTPGGKALISWSGTMFEYLMPFVVMRDFPTTILGRTGRAVVQAHRRYGARQSIPWGISESAYSGVDFEKTYQYRAFGVPGLGLKRGLSEDLVVSPYSTFLALPFLPDVRIGVTNLHDIEREGGRGDFGFYEAIDYTPSRHLRTDGKHIVQAFFAHHQGMSLVAINNLLQGDVMRARFHRQPVVRAAELLLHERFPDRVSTIVPHEPELAMVRREEEAREEPGLEVISSPHTKAPRVRLLSNGRYTVMVDSAGGGFSLFDRSTMLTRWREDPTTTSSGCFVYVRDVTLGKTWSVAYQPTCVEPDSYDAIFSPGRAEFKRFDQKLFVHTEITVAPEDDVELRRITLTNLGDTERELQIISYLEPVLTPRRADAVHPAFSKLFIRPEVLADHDAILFSRRPRSEGESELFFFHRTTLKRSYAPIEFCTSRAVFIGRGNSMQQPAATRGTLTDNPAESGIDPIASLRCTVRLEAGASETITFVSGAARSRRDALNLIERYQELLHISRAFELSWSRAQVELRNHAYSASQADLFHRLAGCLVYNEDSVRGTPDVLAANRLPQSGLWRFGISGDLPIVLIKINDVRQGKVVQELLLAHHFLRERGLEFDLVILHKNPGSYMQPLAEDLEYIIRLSPAGALVDRPGGIFLRSSLQISDAEATLLETVARVVIDASVGGLGEVLATPALTQIVPNPPPATRKRSPQPFRNTAPTLTLANGIGGFDPSDLRYVMPRIGTQRPPLPWSNVVANPHFGFLVTEAGGGYTWSGNSRENRLTSWSNDPVMDPPSEVLYVRRSESGEYWSLTPQPAGDGLDFQVEHRFGSSSFSTNNAGIDSRLTLSASNTDAVKWYEINLTNTEQTDQKLELYLYTDLVLGVLREESYRFVSTSFDRTAQTVCAVNYYNNEFAGRVVFAGSSEPIVSYTGSRLEFLGRNGDLRHPAALERGALHPLFVSRARPVKLAAATGVGIDPCVVLQVSIALKPREERTLHFFLAEASSFEAMRRDAAKFRSPPTRRADVGNSHSWWREVLSRIQVETPSAPFNALMNGWLLYQTLSCRLFGRSGFYQSGGAIGFRDQLQDSLALLPTQPELVRSQILLHATRQFKEGDVQHWWHPPTGRGVRTRITDDLLWLPYVVSRYIEVTGDFSILHEQVPFLEGAPLNEHQMEAYFIPEQSLEQGTILEHCLRTFAITERCGEHGLPLIGGGDWNDGMNEVGRHGKGESVWLGWFQIHVLERFMPLLHAHGDLDRAAQFERRCAALRAALETYGWDGAWYRRAFYDDGTPIGSAESEECRIDSLAQSWAIISGAGSPERTELALRAAQDHLVDTEARIIKLLTPPFDKTQKNPGYIKGYPPGIRENGGQYTHAAAWLILALAQRGRGNEAFELFDLINPINAAGTPGLCARYQGEPYVFCGDVYAGDGRSGRAGWSWYTGSAGWMYQAGLEHILGVKIFPGYLTVEPTMPSSWGRATVTYRRGERTYQIEILNPSGKQHGVRSVRVNGVQVVDNRIPFESPDYGTTVAIQVTLG